jgi:hypothetical protein
MERRSGNGSDMLRVSWPNVRAARFVRIYDSPTYSTYTAFTADELASIGESDSPLLVRTDGGVFPSGVHNIEVGYTFGLRALDGHLRKMMFRAIRADIASTISGIPDRAISFQPAEGGNFVIATPGMGRWETGIPDVDKAIIDHRYEWMWTD